MNKIKLNKAGFIPAFTMIELVFVIVVIGILSAIAIPKLAASRDDAILVKGKSQIAAIRSGIAMQKNKRLLEGTTPFIPKTLDKNASPTTLFHDGDYGNILEYGLSIGTKDGQWSRTSQSATGSTYKFHIEGTTVQFDYNASNGIFDCNHSVANCKSLTE